MNQEPDPQTILDIATYCTGFGRDGRGRIVITNPTDEVCLGLPGPIESVPLFFVFRVSLDHKTLLDSPKGLVIDYKFRFSFRGTQMWSESAGSIDIDAYRSANKNSALVPVTVSMIVDSGRYDGRLILEARRSRSDIPLKLFEGGYCLTVHQ